MRRLLLFLSLITAAFPLIAQEEPGGPSINAMVSVRVDGLDQALWQKVSTRVGKEAHMNIEYSCVATGIIILRMRNVKATDRSDVMTIVKRMLHEAGVKGQIDFLDVHVEPGDGNRCAVPFTLSYCCG